MRFARYVGVPPGTTTLVLGQEEMTAEQYNAEQIRLYAEDIAFRKKEARWRMIGTIATGGLSIIAVTAAIGAWIRTGRLTSPSKVR